MENAPHTSPWLAAIAMGTLALLISGAGLVVLRGDMAASTKRHDMRARETADSFSSRLSKLETLPAADPTGKAAIAAATQPLSDRIIALEAQLAAAEARIETLEKAPAPTAEPVAAVAPPAPPATAPAPATATPAAPAGDTAPLETFHAIVAGLPAIDDQASSTAKQINQRFAGLITIRKPAPDMYAPLRNVKTIGEARAAVATLPVEKQAPFTEWLKSLDATAASAP